MVERHTLLIMLREFLALLRRLWMSTYSPPSSDDAAEIGELVLVREIFVVYLDWAYVIGVQ